MNTIWNTVWTWHGFAQFGEQFWLGSGRMTKTSPFGGKQVFLQVILLEKDYEWLSVI